MNKNIFFEVGLFDPDNTLIALFEERAIKFRKIPVTRKFVVAMDETIEVLNNDNSEILIENLVLIFIEWLREKPHRKLQAQLNDGSIVFINENDIESVTNIVKRALKITVFDPEYNNQILNK